MRTSEVLASYGEARATGLFRQPGGLGGLQEDRPLPLKGPKGRPRCPLRGSSMTESAGVKELCLFYFYTISTGVLMTRTTQKFIICNSCFPLHDSAREVSTPPIQVYNYSGRSHEKTVLQPVINLSIFPRNRCKRWKCIKSLIEVYIRFLTFLLISKVRYTSKY